MWSGTARDLVPQLVDAGTGVENLPMVPAGCGATCSTPAGTVQPLPDIGTALAGRWRICGNWPGGLPSGVVGIQLDPISASQPGPDGGIASESGNGYLLVDGPSGPVPKTDFGSLLTWTVAGNDAFIRSSPTQGAEVMRYSPCPMEFELAYDLVIVPFGN
jgi:hypothetical protein